MQNNKDEVPIEEFYQLKIRSIWRHMKTESFAFWMICFYLAFEYLRPQGIFPVIDFLPWAQIFIILSAVSLLLGNEKRWVSNSANKWMILFLCSILLSSFNAYWPSLSYSKLADFYTWLIIYFLFINIVTTEKRLFIALMIIVLASFKMSFHGARTWALRGFGFTSWGLSGPAGYFQNSGELAIQMLILFGLGYGLYFACSKYVIESRPKRYFLLALMITSVMTILGASSRGAQLALLLQSAYLFFKDKFSFKALVVVIVLVSAGYFLLPEEQMERFATTGSDKTSIQRILYWENGWEMMRNRPYTGVGYFNFIPYFERYHSEDMLYSHAELAHNIFIQVGADLGFVGLFIYLMIILSFFKNARSIFAANKKNKASIELVYVTKGCVLGFVGFLIAGQFVSVVYYPFMWIQLAIIASILNIYTNLSQSGKF